MADFAAGRDVLGSGADALQLKLGVRVAEVAAKTTMSDQKTLVLVFPVIGPPGTPLPTQTFIGNIYDTHKSTFLGAGPRVGVEGSAPIAPGWSLDYLADAAVLFGTQRFDQHITGDTTVINSATGVIINLPARPVTNTRTRGATVFNADLQLGVSYWLNSMVKVSASYRLDAFFGVLSTFDAANDFERPTKIDRYFHGPRVAVSGTY